VKILEEKAKVITDSRLGPTAADYQAAFNLERMQLYPMVSEFEDGLGYAVDRERLEGAARVLACPLKAHPPNWQHGRVLYAAARKYLAHTTEPVSFLDIGTAKGFSALCLAWAIADADVRGTVVTVDVIDPHGRIFRNSVADLGGLKTLYELLSDWPESTHIEAHKCPGVLWLEKHPERIHFAFVDGKHTGSVVWHEGLLLAEHQQPGDVVIFDDVDRPDVWDAVQRLKAYKAQRITILPHRAYAVAVRV